MPLPDALQGLPITHHQVALRTTGVDGPLHAHVVVAGPPEGAPVVLLHGFPELWLGWRHQIPGLARAGYRVIVPDQRGYGGTDKPAGWRPYRLRHLVDDVAALQDALCGGAPTHVVGHDWGGGVAWAMAALRPARVRTLTVLNCPRAEVLWQDLRRNPRQFVRSAYMLGFQIPGLAERWFSGEGVATVLRAWSRRGCFTEDDLRAYARAFTPEATRGALSWYRAALRDRGPQGPVTSPTLLIWGTADRALGEHLAAPSLAAATDGRLERVVGASHFVQHERPDEVLALLLAHLDAHGGPDAHVYKLVDRRTWSQVGDAWTGSEVDHRDGFVHLSSAAQVAETSARHFQGVADLLKLAVDPARLPPGALRWEVSRGGARFPHLYAPLPRAAVVREERWG